MSLLYLPFIVHFQWVKQHTNNNLCKNEAQMFLLLTCFRSFDNGLNSIQIVIYARITEHTCFYCIDLFFVHFTMN